MAIIHVADFNFTNGKLQNCNFALETYKSRKMQLQKSVQESVGGFIRGKQEKGLGITDLGQGYLNCGSHQEIVRLTE